MPGRSQSRDSLARHREPGQWWLKDHRPALPGTCPLACELHEVSRAWFYEQQTREEQDVDQALSQDIEAVVEEFSGYGYRRVTRELARRGRPANHKRVLRVMRERRLLCRPKRRYRATTASKHNEKRFPNLLREVTPTRPDQVWQAGGDVCASSARLRLPGLCAGRLYSGDRGLVHVQVS